jgi:heavy metal sensor kinase
MSEGLEALERFKLMLFLAAPLLLIVASAGGYWLSTRALGPVDEISQAAQKIGIENLADRLQVPHTGDQLQRLSETLNATFARLEASVLHMKQFTADASHELRAPISLIRATAEIALQKYRSAAEYREALEEILEESERTSQVVGSLMLLARADSGKEALDRGPADACAIVRGAIEQGEKLARRRNIEFNASVPSGPIAIQGDADALRRAVLILLDNAVKYTPEGGAVKVNLAEERGNVIVSIIDTGIGIAKEDIAHIFDRFWRVDRARSREQGGAGLGLSIAKWIVEAHRGSIGLESTLGRGSVFSLRIPVDSRNSKQD